jgi:hypothetical protein
MASFTDNPASVQFNPYISEVPVEPMVRTGMALQDQYVTGLQKIQSWKDQLLSLPIAKAEVQQYVKNKVTDMRSSLAKGVAGDFGDSRLLNQIGGYVSKVAKDPIVINGVESTARYQKALSDMETARKEGKWAPENEDLLMSQASQWLGDGRADTTFDAQYVPYTDVNADLLKVINEYVPEDSQLTQMPWVTDENGDVVYKNGVPQINTVTVERLVKGKSKEKLMAALNVAMTPKHQQQLAITGRYVYKSKTGEELYNTILDGFRDQEKMYFKQKEQLITDIALQKDDNRRASMQSQLDKLEESYKSAVRSTKETLDLAQTDPDTVKAEVYKNQYIANLLNGFSSSNVSTKEIENPRYQAWFNEQKFKWEQEKAKNDDYWKEKNYLLEVKKYDLDAEYKLFQMGKKKGPNADGSAGGGYTPAELEGSPVYVQNMFTEETDQAKQQRTELNRQITLSMLRSNPNNRGLSDTKLLQDLAKMAATNGERPEDLWARLAQRSIETWKSAPEGVPVEYQNMIRDVNRSNQILDENKKIEEGADQYVRDNAKDFKPVVLSEVLGTLSNITIPVYEVKRGKITSNVINNATLTREDVLNFGLSLAGGKQGEAAERKLKSKFGGNYDAIRFEALKPKYGIRSEGKRMLETPSLETTLADENTKKSIALREEYFRKNWMSSGPMRKTLASTPEEKKASIAQLSKYNSKYKNASNEEGAYDFQAIQDALNDPENFNANLYVQRPNREGGQWMFRADVTDKNGKVHSMRLTPQEAQELSGDEFIATGENVVKRTSFSQYGSTNFHYHYQDPNAWKESYFHREDFPRVNSSKYTVAADAVRIPGENNQFVLKLYIKPSGADQFTMREVPMKFSAAEVETAPLGVTDALIEKLLKPTK